MYEARQNIQKVSRTIDKVSNGVVQAKFSSAGILAKRRVANITGEDFRIDPYGGATFAEWHPNGARIGFNHLIRDHIINNAPHDTGNPSWITCNYCKFEYPKERIQVDHRINWKQYCSYITTASNIDEARAIEVYIGCNDPYNLVASCDCCNASKGDRNETVQWIISRQNLAKQLGGF
jgi:hypothetical protein